MGNVHAGIVGTGHSYPEGILTNADLAKMVETSDDWITSRTGIKQRRKAAPGEYTSQFAVRAARQASLSETHDTVVLRVEGDNEAGLGFRLTQQWATAGISLQGLTMAVLGNKFVGFAVFDTVADANKAAQILADLGAGQ